MGVKLSPNSSHNSVEDMFTLMMMSSKDEDDVKNTGEHVIIFCVIQQL